MVQERELVGEMSIMAVINFYFHMKFNNLTPFEKRLCLNHIKPLRLRQPKLQDWSILFSLSSASFHLLVLTEPAVPSMWLLGLSWKLYPCNMLCMLNKELTGFMQSLSQVRQNRASKRTALLAGCTCYSFRSLFLNYMGFTNFNAQNVPEMDPGEGPGGLAPPPICLDQTEAQRAQKIFF